MDRIPPEETKITIANLLLGLQNTVNSVPLIGVGFVLLILKQRNKHFVQRCAENSESRLFIFDLPEGIGFKMTPILRKKCAFSGTPVHRCTKVLVVYYLSHWSTHIWGVFFA